MKHKLTKTQRCLLAAFVQLAACLVIYFFKVPNPNIILFVILSAALVQYGYAAGSACGAIAFLYSAFFFSTNHSWLSYTPINSMKLLVIGLGIVMNIIIIGQLQRKWEQANQEKAELEIARQVNASKEQVLSCLSHDIRTPLNGILGLLQVIKDKQDDKQAVLDKLNKIELAASQLLSLTNDAIDASYFRYGKVQLDQQVFKLHDACEEAITISKYGLQDDSISFSCSYDKGSDMALIGSPYLIRRLLLNLYSNAIKYNRPGGFIHTEVRLLKEDAEQAVFELTVEDNGIGMTKEFAEKHLFEMFAQEHPGARTQYHGSGLGMPIVKQIVELLRGEISVHSEVDKGSAFIMRFTFAKNKKQPQVAAKEVQAVDIKGTKILLVEDNALNMEVASYLLSSAGASVTKAKDGAEAVQLFEASAAGAWDFILMDIMMPVLDGLEATKKIRSLERSDAKAIPIFAMTANVFPEDIQKCLAAGMNEHLAKPLELDKLLGLLSKYR